MRYINSFNESDLWNEREDQAELEFKEAYLRGSSSPNVDYLGKGWGKIASKYHLYDNYYLYEDAILLYQRIPSGDWSSESLTKLKVEPHVFKTKIFDRMQKLEIAFNKI